MIGGGVYYMLVFLCDYACACVCVYVYVTVCQLCVCVRACTCGGGGCSQSLSIISEVVFHLLHSVSNLV